MEQQMIVKFEEKVNVSEIIANDEIQVNKIKALTFWDFNTISVGEFIYNWIANVLSFFLVCLKAF